MKAIVTAGGTREPIDDVRYISNFSTGKFGLELACALVESGFETTVACAPDTLARAPIPNASFMPFTSAKSLKEYMYGVRDVDVVFHAAAVADFTPVAPVSGKISSDQERLTIELMRTPKIISELREHFGRKTFLVGFKLLSGVDANTLIDAARAQNEKYRLNLTIANDLSEIKDGSHPVWLVTPEGGAIRITGDNRYVAECIVAFVKKRMQTTWFRTEHVVEVLHHYAFTKKIFSQALSFMQSSGLFYDTSGNFSIALKNEFGYSDIIVTPRHVDKRVARTEDCPIVSIDFFTHTVHSRGANKPSIDTGMQDMLYGQYYNLNCLMHFHCPWGLFHKKTRFPYPCGTTEEGNEIIQCLGGDIDIEFAIELLHHGALIGFDLYRLEQLIQEWELARDEHIAHLKDVGQESTLSLGVQRPIFLDTHIVGSVLEVRGMVAPFVSEKHRGHRIGYALLNQIKERRMPVVTVDDCRVVDFYRKHGFTGEKDSQYNAYILQLPHADNTDELFSRMHEWSK